MVNHREKNNFWENILGICSKHQMGWIGQWAGLINGLSKTNSSPFMLLDVNPDLLANGK